MPKFEGLVPGRIVRFVNEAGAILPAVVIEANRETSVINLGAFGLEYHFHSDICYDETRSMSTWHWPPSGR